MLHKCANPACTAIFRYMREGKMFYVETEVFSTPDTARPHGERRKRCGGLSITGCVMSAAVHITLTFDQHKGILTVPLPDGIGKKTIRMMSPDRVLA